MKPIRITEKNREAIERALASANGKATRHTMHSYSDVNFLAAAAQTQLTGAKLPQKLHVGATAEACQRVELPNSYGYAVATTAIAMARRPSGWFLTGIRRREVRQSSGRVQVTITPRQAREIRDRAVAEFAVRPEGDGNA